jgi:LysR family transcriptional activator of nhaA
MEWLNYHHLLYFWTVAREGSIAKASQHLRLAQPTISGQIRMLEQQIGDRLFLRSGRRLVLTEMGRLVYGYADEIFTIGRELLDAVRGRHAGGLRLVVGVDEGLPKLVARHLLLPALHMPEELRLVCREDRFDRLLAELATHELDLVLSDSPVPSGMRIRAFHHLLGECGVAIFSHKKDAAKYRKNFPNSLREAPFLMPLENSTMRRGLEDWLEKVGVEPRVVGEFEDSALLKTFAADGLGLFAGPVVIADRISDMYHASVIGEVPGLESRFYAISVERRLKNPAVLTISQAARTEMFRKMGLPSSNGKGHQGGKRTAVAPSASSGKRAETART